MDFVIIVLGILYLLGYNVGKALAICAIVEVLLLFINAVLKEIEKKRAERNKFLEGILK